MPTCNAGLSETQNQFWLKALPDAPVINIGIKKNQNPVCWVGPAGQESIVTATKFLFKQHDTIYNGKSLTIV